MKQWADAEASSIQDCVVVYVGQALRDMLHPSEQALRYKQYLEDSSTVFSEGKVRLAACSYLSNHQSRVPAFSCTFPTFRISVQAQANQLRFAGLGWTADRVQAANVATPGPLTG